MKPPSSLVSFGAAALLAGCASNFHLEEPLPSNLNFGSTPPLGEYRIAVGDQLLVEFARNWQDVAIYRLGIGDGLQIRVHELPANIQLDLDTAVNPDGSIHFHRMGRIQAEGKSLEELREVITAGVRETYSEAVVDLFLSESDYRTEKFISLLLQNPTGSTRELTVNQNGRISVPGVGAMQVRGRTLEEAEADINASLRTQGLHSLSVSLNSTFIAENKYTVVGEVTKPGTFQIKGQVSLIEALASAGWETDYADMEKVAVLSIDANGGVLGRLYDVKNAMLHGSALQQVHLLPKDTVLVLRTGIGNANRYMEQWVREMMPINFGAGYRIQDS
ncbi:MAG: polysaccharide biosynthesis/export family protein [Planctomycetes bacterium]|nr:polysaccharide biosynthesis/export family protein [Planctomycetota bacterium]